MGHAGQGQVRHCKSVRWVRVLFVEGRDHTLEHRNLALVFDLERCVTSVSKTAAQRLEERKPVFQQYNYSVRLQIVAIRPGGIDCHAR